MKIIMRDGSGTVDLKYLMDDMDRYGNVRVYFRRKGQKKIRIRETPGTPEFMEVYRTLFVNSRASSALPGKEDQLKTGPARLSAPRPHHVASPEAAGPARSAICRHAEPG